MSGNDQGELLEYHNVAELGKIADKKSTEEELINLLQNLKKPGGGGSKRIGPLRL